MKNTCAYAVIALAMLTTPASAQVALPSVQATELHIITSQGRMYPANNAAVYYSTCQWTGTACGNTYSYPNGTWVVADLTRLGVPTDAKGAFVSGTMIISHGSTSESADLHWTFRMPGDTAADCTKYVSQVTETSVGNGQRSGAAHWVPLVDGKFEWCVQRATSGTWPTNSSYAINLTLEAWAR